MPDRWAALPPESEGDLTRSILARTSGSACARLRESACAYVDGEVQGDRRFLMEAHLAHCSSCASWVKALQISTQLLPRMASLSPGVGFTDRVLQATSKKVVPLRSRASATQLWQRPRIAWELAFVGAAASLLLMSLPIPARMPQVAQPLRGAFARTAGPMLQAQQRTAAAVQRVFHPAPGDQVLWQRVSHRIRSGWKALRDRMESGKKAPNP